MGHADVDDHDVRLVRAGLAQQVLAVAGLADDLDPGFGQEAAQALAQQDRVVGDHGAHGISARTTVPAPGAPVTCRRPSTAPTRSARPRRPDPWAGSAPP